MWYLRVFLLFVSEKGPQDTYRTISTLSDNETPGRCVCGVIPITIPCVYFLEIFGQLLWFLHAFLLFEAKNGHHSHVWLDLPCLKLKTKKGLSPCALFWSEGGTNFTLSETTISSSTNYLMVI